MSDVARVELGAADYASNTYLSGEPTVLLGVFQRPGSNALAAAELGPVSVAAGDVAGHIPGAFRELLGTEGSGEPRGGAPVGREGPGPRGGAPVDRGRG